MGHLGQYKKGVSHANKILLKSAFKFVIFYTVMLINAYKYGNILHT